MKIGLALAAALLLSAAGGPQDPPAGKPKPTQEAREKRAAELWEQAGKLEKEGKPAEAQDKLRELRSRCRATVFYFENMIEISDKINEIGTKLAMAALGKTTLYKKPHMDSWFSYEFLPPNGWKGVPPDAAVSGDMDSSESNYAGQLIRVSRYTSSHLDKLSLSVWKVYDAKSVEGLEVKLLGWLERSYKGIKQDGDAKQDKGRSPYVRKLFSTPDGDRVVLYYFVDGRRALALVGAWRTGGEDNGFVIVTTSSSGAKSVRKTAEQPVTKEQFDAALKVFDQSAKSFWIYDASTRQGKAVQLNHGALCSDWNTMVSAKGSYLIEYATRSEFAKRIGEELETIVGLYREVIPTGKATPQVRVKVFDREEDFVQYAGFYGAAAYWSPAQEEIVCYRFEGDKVKLKESSEEFTIAEDKNPEDVTFKILYHEAFHQYIYYVMSRERMVYVPSWLNEGLGDYFFGGAWGKSPRKFAVGVNDWRVKKIVTAVKDGRQVPLDKILRYEQRQYYTEPGLCYAEGWSIIYFLLTSDVAKKKGWQGIPRAMIEALKTSGNWEKATDKVFAGIDLKKMEEEWKEFVLALPVPKDAKDDEHP